MLVATLVAPIPILTKTLVTQSATALKLAGARIQYQQILDGTRAVDVMFEDIPLDKARTVLRTHLKTQPIDIFVQPLANRAKKLLIADMDSTMITIECIDELADFVGKRAEVSAVTEAAMRGELDFIDALDARVSLLRGLDAAILERCFSERLRYTPGAKALVQTMKAKGAHTVLVSGGFTYFADKVAQHLGFAFTHANKLDMEGGRLTGTVARPVVTAEVKQARLVSAAEEKRLPLADTLAVGDGANDIPMIESAGFGVAYRAKQRTRAAAAATIDHTDLGSLLFAQGYRRKEWLLLGR